MYQKALRNRSDSKIKRDKNLKNMFLYNEEIREGNETLNHKMIDSK